MDSNSARLAQELRDLADQLRFLEATLTSSRTRLTAGQCLLNGEPVDIELLSDFKSALDHARHSVWALLEALAGYSGHTVDEVLQNYRMQRASELLHVLRSEIESPTITDSIAARTFLDEVQIVADLAYRRHMR
jgi:uncharacterized protein (DUF433 family)